MIQFISFMLISLSILSCGEPQPQERSKIKSQANDFLTSKTMQGPFSDVKVVNARSRKRCPWGYSLLDLDLNYGAGGNYIFFCLMPARTQDRLLVSDIKFSLDDSCPSGYDLIDEDLNDGSNGDYIYACIKRSIGENPIKALQVTADHGPADRCSPNFVRVPQDLNDGARGKYIYVCINRDPVPTPAAVGVSDPNFTIKSGPQPNSDLPLGATQP